MSNFLAVAAVTGTLRNLLNEAAGSAISGAKVTTKRPDGAAANQGAGINVFLYHVTPNAAYRNEDLPTRRSAGDLVQRPRAAVVLHYLLSFFGDEKDLEPQRLLGAAIRQLHSRPQLSKKQIDDTMATAPFDGLTEKPDLSNQLDRVRFTPSSLSLDEVSKLWSVFFQSPYLLSVAYEASAVLIETSDTPRTSIPVLTRTIEAVPFKRPVIERIAVRDAEGAPIQLASTLAIRGKQLRGEMSSVLLDGAELTPASYSQTEIVLPIPAGTSAGPHTVKVIHKAILGIPKVPHIAIESDIAAFVLHPKIASIDALSAPGILRIAVDVDVTANQHVSLILDSTDSAKPRSLILTPKKRATGQTEFRTDVSKVPAGTYFVRMQIDGAASLLDLDPSSPTSGPKVTLA